MQFVRRSQKPAQFLSMIQVTDILAVTDQVRFKHTKQRFEPPQIKHIQLKQFEHQHKLRCSVIYNEYLRVNTDFIIRNNIIKKCYYQDKVILVQHNYPTNSSIGNFKEPAKKLRLSKFVLASFYGTCLLFLSRKVTDQFFYSVHDYCLCKFFLYICRDELKK